MPSENDKQQAFNNLMDGLLNAAVMIGVAMILLAVAYGVAYFLGA